LLVKIPKIQCILEFIGGYISLIEGLVKRIKEEKNFNYYVIATGGLSNLFSKNCSIIEKVDNELTLNGLIHIYNINKS